MLVQSRNCAPHLNQTGTIYPPQLRARLQFAQDQVMRFSRHAPGPDATIEQPGTFFVAVTGPTGTRSMKMVMAQGRGATKRRAITTALMLLRGSMLEEE